MRTWTFLAEHINKNNMTYYIQNWGWNEEEIYKNLKLDEDQKKIFKRTYFNGFEKDIQENEFKVLMQEVIKNLNVIGVYEISNHYNRDQATINQMKDNRRLIWESKGYTEINHCEPLEIDTEGGKTIINLRDYLYILNEKITNKEKEYDELDKDLKEYKKYIKDEKYHALLEATRQLEMKKEKLEEEYLITEEEIEQNKEKIKKQNWFIRQKQDIEKEYDELKENFDKLVKRYKDGEKICAQQIEEAKNNWPQELKELETNINESKSNLLTLKTIINEKNKNIEKLNLQIKELESKENNIKKSICNLNKNGSVILEKIITEIFNKGIMSKDELKEKFLNTYKMYIMNDLKFPEFEIDYAKSQGLSDDDIQDLINIFK